jgi:hypothetical protein
MPRGLYFMSAAVWNGRIYVAGGADGTNLYADVWSAQIQTNGSLSPWVAQTPLPVALYTHTSVANRLIYVLGGIVLTNNGTEAKYVNTVYYSRINADGSLAGWNQTTPMPQPLSCFGAVAARGQIFVACGVNGQSVVNTFYSAPVAGDGSLGIWSLWTAKLIHYLNQFGMAVTDGYIFLAGGSNGSTDFKEVQYLALPPSPATPVLAPQHFGTNGALRLQLTSTTNTGFGFEASTNLADWDRIGWGFTDTNGSLLLQDTNAANFPNRFYRAYWPLP